MSRPAVAAALAAFALLALPAATAQAGQPLAISKLAASASTNATRLALPFEVDFSMPQGSCPGGGTAVIALASTSSNSTVKATVQPVSMTFDFGQLDVVRGRSFSPSTGILLVETPDLVSTLTTSDIKVTASSSFTCTAQAPPPATADGMTKVTFRPDVAEKIANNGASEAMPGLELPAVALALLGAVLLARRRSA